MGGIEVTLFEEMETTAGSAGIPPTTPVTTWFEALEVTATVTGVSVTRAPARGSPVPTRVTIPSTIPPPVSNCLAAVANGRARSERTAIEKILMKEASERRSADSGVGK
jgi:hypothetical protein